MKKAQERTLHLVDIENLIGTASLTTEVVGQCRSEYEGNYFGPRDQITIACSHHAYASVAWGWQKRRLLPPRSGKDGADLALLDVIAFEPIVGQFGYVVVASGDGIFTDAVSWLAQQGVDVTVVARPESLSNSLRMAAARFIPFSFGTSESQLGTPA